MTIYCYCSIFLIMTMIFSITMTGLLRLATMTMTCDDLGRHCREVSHWAASDPSPDNLRGEPGKSTIGGSSQQNIHHPLKKGEQKGDSNGYLRMKKLKNEWCKDYLYIYACIYTRYGPLRLEIPMMRWSQHEAQGWSKCQWRQRTDAGVPSSVMKHG